MFDDRFDPRDRDHARETATGSTTRGATARGAATMFDRCNIVSESDLRAGVDRLAAYVKKLPKETIVEPLKKAQKDGKSDTDKKRTIAKSSASASLHSRC